MKRLGYVVLSNISLILMILALTAFVVAGLLFCLQAGLIVLGAALAYLSFVISVQPVKKGGG